MSCKIVFKKEHQKNEEYNRSEKLLYASVYDNEGNTSKLWDELQKVPFVKNLEEVENLMLNTYKKGFNKEGFIKYENSNEPKLFYKSSNGNVYFTYKEALVDSDSGNIEIGFVDASNYKITDSLPVFNSSTDDVILYNSGDELKIKILNNKNFTSILTVNSNYNVKTVEGFINNMIKNDLLSGKQTVNTRGELVYEPNGEQQTLKSVNGALVFAKALIYFDRNQVNRDSNGNIKIDKDFILYAGVEDKNGKPLSLEETIQEVKDKGFEQLVDKTSEEHASDLVVSDFIKSNDFEKFLNNFPILEKTKLSDLRDKLFSLINRMGIQLLSIEEYKKNYQIKNNIDVNAKALADLSNGVIALGNNASINDLSEELSHFLVETIDEKELSTLLNDLYLTESVEYQKESAHYRELYSKQGLSEEDLETKVRKEILGKLISKGILDRYNQSKSEQEKTFFGKVINFIKNIIDKIKFHFNNPRIQIEIQDIVAKISDEVINEEIEKTFNIDNITTRYNSGVNALYYSSTSDKARILEFQKAIDVLENRLKLVKEANVKNINAYKNAIRNANDALNNGYQWLAAKLIISEAENLAKKLEKSLNIYEKNQEKGNIMLIKTDNDLLRDQLVPSVENLRNIVEDLETSHDFTERDKTQMLQQIKNLVTLQSENNSKFNKVAKLGNAEMLKLIAEKYGVNETFFPYIIASLTKKQNDISALYQWFGNPEHASNPVLGLLAKILQNNELRKIQSVSKLIKPIEKFLTEKNWKHENYHSVMEKRADGSFTYNLLNPIDIEKFETAKLNFETDLYNKLQFGQETDKYVTSEEYSKGYRLNDKKEKIEAISKINEEGDLNKFNNFTRELQKWKEENTILQYEKDVYRERNSVYEALRLSSFTRNFLSNLSSDKASVYSKISNKDGDIDPSKLDKDVEALDELSDINARRKDASSPYDVNTGKTYFTVDNSIKEKVISSYTNKDGNVVTTELEIPKIVFIDEFAKYNDNLDLFEKEASLELKQAYDLTRLNYYNQAKYGNDSRTINEKFNSEIKNIENFYSKEKGYDNFEEVLRKAGEKDREEIITNINNSLRKFTEIIGGLSFNEDFYKDLSLKSEGLSRIDKLNMVIDNVDNLYDEKTISSALLAKSNILERTEIYKKYRSKFNPAEIDYELIPQSVLDKLKSLDESIDTLMSDIIKTLPKTEVSDYEDVIASYNLNDSFYKSWKDSKLGIVDFMLNHVKNKELYLHIKSDFKNFQKYGVPSSFKSFLGRNNYLSKNDTVNQDFINAIETEAGLESVISKFLENKVYSYFKRFTPNGYEQWMNDLNEGVYKDENGKNSSFGNFLRNMVNKQNGESYNLNNKVESYFKINPALQYTDGSTKSFKEQLNPLYNKNYTDGYLQPNLDLYGNKDYFNRFGIDFENFKNNPLLQEQLIQEAAEKNDDLKFINMIRDINKLSYELYGETNNFSSYRIGRKRMTESESIRNFHKPLDRIKGWYKEVFTRNIDTQDEGAMVDGKPVTELNKNLRVIPKYGLYDLEDMEDMSTDILYNTVSLLSGAVNYDIKRNNMADVLKLESILEQQEFVDGKKGKDTNTYKMFKEFVDAQYFGILRNKKWEVNLMGKKVDLTRWISAIDRYVRKVNTAWSLAVSVTGLTSFSMFGLTEGLVKENFSDGAMTFGLSQVLKEFGSYTKEIGQIDRNNKAYLTSRLLGIEGFDPLHNASASGRSKLERVLKHPSHKITEVFTNHTGPQIAYAMLYDTRFYEGKWYSFNEFRNYMLLNNKTSKEVKTTWDSLKESSLFNNYDFSENNERIKVSENGLQMMSDYYKNLFNEENQNLENKFSEEEINKKVQDRVDEINKNLFNNVSGRINSLHSFLEGRIRQEQASSATRNALINPLLAHRGWFSNAIQKKFKNGQFNFITGQYEVGSINNVLTKNPIVAVLQMYKSNKAISEYREGLTDLIMNPKLSNSQKELYDQIKNVFGEKEANDMAKIMLDTNQRAVKRIGIETMLLSALLLVGALVAGYVDDPDKKDEFAIQYMGYMYFRLASEYGSSHIVTGATQTVDMVNRPAIMFNLFKEIVNEDNYSFDPVKSGPYKGMPKIAKAIAKQTSLRQLYDFGDITKKSQGYRHWNSASMGWFLEKDKEEDK